MEKGKKKIGRKIIGIALIAVIAALFIILLIMASETLPKPELGEGIYSKDPNPKLMSLFLFLFFVPLPILAFAVAIQGGDDETVAAPEDLDLAAMIVLISVVMNADGQNSKEELDEARFFIIKKFGEKKAKKLLLLLNEKLNKDIRNVRPHCARVRRLFRYSERLEFMTLLFRIAEASGEICRYEVEALRNIAHYTDIDDSDFIELTYKFTTFYNYQKRQAANVHYDVSWAYKALFIEENASIEEIKKAYRKLAMQHHPDKVNRYDIAAQKEAAEKFRRIKEAYECLRKEKV